MNQIKKAGKFGFCFTVSLLLLLPTLYAQITAERQVLGIWGKQVSNEGIVATQTAGEVFTATLQQAPFTATQGFQQWQGNDIPLNIDLTDLGIQELSLYPNPATDKLNIKAETTQFLDLSFSLYDLYGRKLLHLKNALDKVGYIERQVTLGFLPEGHYFATFQTQEGEIVYREVIQKL